MTTPFLIRHGIRMAGLSAMASALLFTVVTFFSYETDQRFIDLWEGYRVSEEQLFKLRVDANRLFEIEHKLSFGGVKMDGVELQRAGEELAKIPLLKPYSDRKRELLAQARAFLLKNQDSRAALILNSRELAQVNRILREELYKFELKERERLQEKLETRLESQEEILRFDVAAILLALALLLSATVLVAFYVQRLRRFDRDIIQARNEAERASKMKSSFLANMSHEIRTPLNGVLGLTRLLRETNIDREQQEIVESLEASGRTLLSIVNDILDLSKIESGKIELERLHFDARALVLDLEKAFRPVADRKGLELKVEGPGIEVPIQGDMVKIRQVLQNLLSNALKFTRSGQVALKWEVRPGPALWFQVSDTGIGIPTESMRKIFYPFEQADSSTSRHFGGSGLGLAICRHLIEAMDGRIGVESQMGRGSRFWFSIPFLPGKLDPLPQSRDTTRRPRPLAASAKVRNSTSRILLVEDNEVNQHLVIAFLKRRGFEVEAAVNGLVALEKLRQGSFGLILMDAHLPEMDGFAATEAIRKGDAGEEPRGLPIIALTASAIKGERERCLDAGMNEYLTKPVDLDQLEATIKSFLGMEETMPESNMPSSESARPHDLDEDLYQDLVKIFLRITPDRVKDLKAAYGRNDEKSVGKSAHTMKSSAAQLGLYELSEVCKKMELKGLGEPTSDQWPDLFTEFDRCLSAVYTKLKGEVDSLEK